MAATQHSSRSRATTTFVFVVAFLSAFVMLRASARSPQYSAYLHPALLQTESQEVAVIVTGEKAGDAVRAVEAAGGRVTSDLWLIGAAGATLSTDQIRGLAAVRGVASIVPDGQVRPALAPGNGYASERRYSKAIQRLGGEQMTPAVPLPDGGAVAVSKGGLVLILNGDGNIRASVQLPSGNYKTSPVVSVDGTIYVSKEEKELYAVAADGSLRWRFSGAVQKFMGGPAIGADGTLYAIDEERHLYALDGTDGRLLWQKQIGNDHVDKVKRAPVVGPDGTLYVVSEKGFLLAVDGGGNVLWTFQAPVDKAFYAPLVSGDGTIYVANVEKNAFAVNMADGSLRYSFQTREKILAPPAVASEGALFVIDEKLHLYAINRDGSQRFVFTPDAGGKFITSPVLSADETTVYVGAEDKWLFAVDATSGVERWRYQLRGKIKGHPVTDRWGNVVVGSEGKDLVFINEAGELVHAMRLSGKVQQTPGVNGQGDLVIRLDNDKVATVGRLPDQWNGLPDVEPTGDPMVWKFRAPVSIDVGADIVHDDLLLNGFTLSGKDVGIAVVDSGVYFDRHVKELLGSVVEHLFLGQADFVGSGICEQNAKDYEQHEGYCWTNHKTSKDRYGHGTHVAGIIWNQYLDYATGIKVAIAPGANVLSVRVLGDDGVGTYEDVIEGIQFVLANKDLYGIRVMNLSLSGYATTPYFADPLNRAVEAAWADGLAVVAAAGNSGPSAESITVPGSDPYVITVGAVDGKRTAGFWGDDTLPTWSASGPTLDGFVKPDVLAPGANIVSFMYNDPADPSNSAYLAQHHPDYSQTTSLFRMNGTSMSAAVTSGVVALMLEANHNLTPDQVKYRLMHSAMTALTMDDEPLFSPLQQGAGRVWVPDAALSAAIPDGVANSGMDIRADLAHLWVDGDILDPAANSDLDFHYLGPVQRLVSDDGQAYLYYVLDPADGAVDPLGIARVDDLSWLDGGALAELALTFDGGGLLWHDDYLWSGGRYSWSGGRYSWSGGRYSWSGGRYSWSGGRYSWSGGRYSWSGGRYSWSGGRYSWSGARYSWSGHAVDPLAAGVSVTNWIDSSPDE